MNEKFKHDSSIEMAALVRSLDWSTTSLGPLESWPSSLQDALKVIIDHIEIKLNEREEILREMADNAPMIIWITDAQGSVRFVHRTSLFLKVIPELEIEQKWENLIHPDDCPSYCQKFLETCNARQKFSAEARARSDDGDWRWLHSLAVPRPEESPFGAGMIGYSIDITERKIEEEKVLAREAFISTITNTAPIIIMLYELATGKALYANRSQQTLFGFTAEEICGMSGEEHFVRLHPEDLRRVLRFIKRCRTMRAGEIASIEYRYRDKAGVYGWFRSNVTPFVREKDNFVTQVLAVAINIDEHKRTEEGISRYAQELLRSNRDLEQFAYVASHDLQEPLHIASTYMEVVKRKYNDKLDEEGREFIESVVENVRKMQELIRDLLTYSRIGSKIMFAEVEMDQVLKQVLKNLSIMIRENNVTIKCDDHLPSINADRTQMIQLFQNLINNAIKFHSPERPPEIQISAEDDGVSWIFSIKDNGLGIAPEHYHHIFDIFKRLHSDEAYPGTGIGLAICKKIVDYHEGRIWVESEHGQGTAFFISIPKETGKP